MNITPGMILSKAHQASLEEAVDENISQVVLDNLTLLVQHGASFKAVLGVVITSLVYKLDFAHGWRKTCGRISLKT